MREATIRVLAGLGAVAIAWAYATDTCPCPSGIEQHLWTGAAAFFMAAHAVLGPYRTDRLLRPDGVMAVLAAVPHLPELALRALFRRLSGSKGESDGRPPPPLPSPSTPQESPVTPSQATGVGAVMSADIAVPEHARELRFYARVLTTGDRPLWRDDLMNGQGVPIIGLGERTPEYADLPLQWMPHIQVADVAASARTAVEQGGREILHHRSGAGQSQWAVLADPGGAAFGIVPTVDPETVPALEGGRIAWLDRTVADDEAQAMRDFYQDVVGWSAEDVAKDDASGPYADYVMRSPGGPAVANIRRARGVNAGLPPVWLLCLPVGDLDESLSRVRHEGGEVVDARRDAAGDLTYAVIRDPVGVHLALVPG